MTRVKQMSIAAYSHQELPFALLVEKLQHYRDPNRAPFFQVLQGVNLGDVVLCVKDEYGRRRYF